MSGGRAAFRLSAVMLSLVLTACAGGSAAGGDSTTTTTAATTTSTSSTTSSTTTTTTTPSTITTGDTTTTTGPSSTSLPSIVGEGKTLLVMGDWGSGGDRMGEVADAMRAYAESNEVEAILTTGDNFYSNDVSKIMGPFSWVNDDGIDWWVTWGNHDEESDARIAAVNEAFDSPVSWTTISWGAADIVILDSNMVDSEEQLAYLKEQMAAITKPTIMVFHHPAYSCSKHGSTDAVVETWVREFDQDVFLVLNGHDHLYERFESNGIVYVVSGGGGRGLYEVESCPPGHPEMIIGDQTNHFLAISQDETGVNVTVIDRESVVIDEFTVSFPG
ncbi:MAG: metallophosphoesterase [Acidimicrobiia bacterium]